jgi:hypothetical protein
MRLSSVISNTVLVVVLSAGAAPAADQERRGFWIGFGAGYGSAYATCDDNCGGNEREGSGSGYVKLGGTLNERVLLGAEMNLWTKEKEGVTLNLYNASATVTFYPKATSGFFLKGGAGLALVDAEVRDESTTITLDLGHGFGVLAGIGYDLRVARNISITPSVNFYAGWPGDLKVEGVGFNNWRQNVVDFTIGVTFH